MVQSSHANMFRGSSLLAPALWINTALEQIRRRQRDTVQRGISLEIHMRRVGVHLAGIEGAGEATRYRKSGRIGEER
jgi:hypothetical protein